MLRSGGKVVAGVWEGWEDGDGHGCEVANNTEYREVEYEAGVGALELLRIARDS